MKGDQISWLKPLHCKRQGQIKLGTKHSLGFLEDLCLLVHTDTPEPVDTERKMDKLKPTECKEQFVIKLILKVRHTSSLAMACCEEKHGISVGIYDPLRDYRIHDGIVNGMKTFVHSVYFLETINAREFCGTFSGWQANGLQL